MAAMIERLQGDLGAALKAGDATAAGTLRMVLSDLKYEELKKGGALADDDVLAVVMRGVKTRRESVVQYAQAKREDLASKERAEIAVLERYLPQALSPEETERRVAEVIRDLSATGKKDMGRVMKESMARLKGQVDGKRVQEIVQKLLP